MSIACCNIVDSFLFQCFYDLGLIVDFEASFAHAYSTIEALAPAVSNSTMTDC